MEAYLKIFVNYKQNDWARLLLIVEFTYNNIKNANIGYILFELNYGYYFHILYQKKYQLLL